MPLARCRSESRRIVVTGALVALVTIAASPATTAAQGGGMGGGGFGPPSGMGGRGRGMGSPRNSSAPDVAKHFEEMASLDAALKHVDGLTKDQKTSFSEIERGYGKTFKALGARAQGLVDTAHAAHERPDPQRMDSLHQQAKQLQDQELTAARDMLSTDAQRDQFDRNVVQLRADEAKREEQMGEHGPPGGPS